MTGELARRQSKCGDVLMSEPAPETTAPAPAQRSGNIFAQRFGPLPLWGWMGIGAALALAYWYYNKKKQASQVAAGVSADSGAASGTTDSSLIPQFVNQTYVENTPPEAPTPGPPGPSGSPGPPGPVGPPGTPAPKPPPQQLTRTWTAIATASTLAQVARRLGTSVQSMRPQNAIAKTWWNGSYSKNKNALIPKGATFTFNEGTVTPKG